APKQAARSSPWCSLKCRCTPTKASTTAQIQALAVEKLEALADALLDFQGPADLAAWLAANG
ncbi:MAG: DUF4351 domain-containing protein, partial [Betaproteobacteria bacterium]|nr:DUF4351 domain-containing protein [Betaproteobacteria bacterium]